MAWQPAERRSAVVENSSTLFRDEAVAYYLRSSRTQGDVLHLSPRWTRWTYWFLVLVGVAGALYGVFGRIHEYATGIAVIRDEGRTMVTAITGGTITAIAVQSGQHVESGQMLLSLNDMQEKIELERLHKEWHIQQINRLKNPHDPGAQQQLATVRAQVDTAEKRLAERTVFAPCAGIVRDLRIRPQQLVTPGEILVTLVGPDDVLSVLAIFPGQYRPFLTPGNPVRLELTGFRYAYQRLTITAVSNEVIGPHEVRRFLGQDVADAVTLQGSQVIVQAPVPASTFHAQGRWHHYHDGMHGTAEVLVRSERLVFALVPGLKAVFEGKHGEDDRPQGTR
ncbi:MAG TPA: HlyD family efflux transporter periplasmic adaptor subunit [Candidatus Saccharimonadia bacterium]|nr:HlyD family efflux transporter periplasmic adaptor subunit [Candidatus Saccharimonadia bacterium]